MNILSVFLGHNASMTIARDGQILEVLEFERITNIKNGGCLAQVGVKNPKLIMTIIKENLKTRYNINHFDLLLLNHLDMIFLKKHHFTTDAQLLKFFDAKEYQLVHHQHGHMACAFYQSDFHHVKGVSFDGGGSDGNFNIFECHRTEGIKQLAYIPHHTLGMRLAELGQYANSIKKERDFWVDGGLVYPGKIMGLSPYGKVRDEWLPAFKEFYTGVYFQDLHENYKKLKQALNLPDWYDGELEADLLATSQRMFEMKFDELVGPYFQNEPAFIITGGSALNIINNERMRKQRNIFVPPNPSDAGLSLGFMLDYLKPKTAFDATYMGSPVWDAHTLPEYVEKYNGKIYSFDDIIRELMAGKIIGVVRGRSELGPRALGNRSIICHAAISGMKDILNEKVKNREPFRPFSPVCTEEMSYKFFNTKGPSRWMSFCPSVKEEHRQALASITHVDGTARLQTVNPSQNDWLYYLLVRFSEHHQYPVILNTSFNIAGKPILNTYRDAVWMLENTKMDGLILEDYYISKT